MGLLMGRTAASVLRAVVRIRLICWR